MDKMIIFTFTIMVLHIIQDVINYIKRGKNVEYIIIDFIMIIGLILLSIISMEVN